MSKKAYTLDRFLDASGNLVVTAAFWLTAPSTRVVVLTPPINTRVPPFNPVTAPNGYTQADLDSLRNGTVVEQVATITLASGATQTTASVQAQLAAKSAAMQTALNNQDVSLPNLVGSAFDGTNWTAGP